MVRSLAGTSRPTSTVDLEVFVKIQHKIALAVLGGIIVVLVIFLVISLVRGDQTNSDNRRGGGVGSAPLSSSSGARAA